jgi:hypothetical protein
MRGLDHDSTCSLRPDAQSETTPDRPDGDNPIFGQTGSTVALTGCDGNDNWANVVGTAAAYIRFLFASCGILLFVSKWCTVTVTEQDGRRHSLDVLAESTYDAAHLFVVEAKKERAVGLPKSTLATIFEVVASGKVYRVAGVALQSWIVERRQKWCGPKGYMFCKRPGLE